MRLNVRDPGGLGPLFLLLRHMDQDIEATEIEVILDDSARLIREYGA